MAGRADPLPLLLVGEVVSAFLDEIGRVGVRHDLLPDPEEALEFLIPEYKYGTFQLGFTSDNDWDVAFIVRNLFDDAGYTYLSSTHYGEFIGEERWRHIRNLQRPRNYSLSFTKRW